MRNTHKFEKVIILNLPTVFRYFIAMRWRLRQTSRNAYGDWILAKSFIRTICVRTRVTVETYGKENIPISDGCLYTPNHQSRFDGLAIIQSIDKPISMVLDKERSSAIFEKEFMSLIRAIPIDKKNPQSAMKSVSRISDRLIEGDNICLFPEGGYSDNGNTLQKFNTGCLHFIKKAEAPIVPVCIFDAYKVYSSPYFRHTTVQVHYLKPIEFNEYRNLRKAEIADLIKSRIQEKLDFLLAKDSEK